MTDRGDPEDVLGDGDPALQPLRADQVRALLLRLLETGLPDGLVITTEAEIGDIEARAYASGWQDGLREHTEAPPGASGGDILAFPLPLVPAGKASRRPLMPHKPRRRPDS